MNVEEALRYGDRRNISALIQLTLNGYLAANDGRIPQAPLEHQPYLPGKIDSSSLQRCQIKRTRDLRQVLVRRDWVITSKSLIDPGLDTDPVIGQHG